MLNITTDNPIICCLSRRAIAEGSMAKVNKIGLKGQPCRVPQCKLNGLEYRLLVKTTAEGALNNLIQEKKTAPNPKFSKNKTRNSHSTLTLSKICKKNKKQQKNINPI